LKKLGGPDVVDGGSPVIRFMMVAEGGLAAVVVPVVLVVGVPVAVEADARIDKVADVVVVVTVGIGTCGAGRFMMLAEGGEGSRGGSAGILRGTRGGDATKGSRGGLAGDTTGAADTSAGWSSNWSSGGSPGGTTGVGGTSAGGSRKGSSTHDTTDIVDTLADEKRTRRDVGVDLEVGAGVGWVDTTEVVATGGVEARGRVVKSVSLETLIGAMRLEEMILAMRSGEASAGGS
jgi:hypothetical protein